MGNARWRRLRAACGAGLFFFLLFSALLATPAGAEISSGCRATIAGRDVGPLSSSDPKDAIDVHYDDVIAAEASTNQPVGAYHIDLEALGVRWTVANGSSATNTWSRQVKVSTYADKVKSGGLIKIIGSGGGCTGAALLSVDYKGKTPLATPLGLAGALLAAVGAVGLAGTAMSSARRR